jgi:DNA invertase Pin-like site-specific DNA recombinase
MEGDMDRTLTIAAALRAVGIVRVSQRGDRPDERFRSPDDQRARIDQVCAKEGWRLLLITPAEINVSGDWPLERRPGLLAAVEMIEAGRADVLVASETDRLWRNPSVRSHVLERVERVGGVVWSGDDGRITDATASEEFTGTVRTAADRMARRVNAEKSRRAVAAAAADGVPPMSLPPGLEREVVGHDRRGKPILGHVVKTKDAMAIKTAVEMKANGATIAAVRSFLADNGIVRSYHGTQSLIASPLLCGRFVFGKDRRPEDQLTGTLPPIVDEATWRRAQTKQPRGRRPSSARLLARAGVLRCATCGSRMVVGTQKQNGRNYPFYRCASVRQDCPRRVAISAALVEEVVVESTRAALEGTVSERTAQDNIRDARDALQRAQANLDAGIRTLADFADEAATVDRLRELKLTRDAALERVDRLGVPDDFDVLLLAADWDQLSTKDKQSCIRATFDRVLVRPAERGTSPRDRLEMVPHDMLARLTGRTPPLPGMIDPIADADGL